MNSTKNPPDPFVVMVSRKDKILNLSARLRGGIAKADRSVPELWRANFGDSPAKRYAVAFVGGFVVLYGARLAGGCTSGHMMSGMMQTALSGYIFAAGAFAAAIPVSMFLFRKEA